MTAFRFNQRRTRRWWYGGGVTLVATLAATLGSSVVLARAPHAKITLTIWSPENRPADAIEPLQKALQAL